MGKGGGGSASTPVEHNDTIESSQMISIIDLWSEGPIKGIKGGLKGVMMDDTPVLASDGSQNIPGVSIEYNVGTEDQDYLNGFPRSASEISVGVQVKKSDPVIRTITDSKIDMLRVNMYCSALYVVENDGDTVETDLAMRVQVRGPGETNWTTKSTIAYDNQKSRNEISFQSEIWDLPATPFDVRVVRDTSDDTTGDFQQIQNLCYWRSYSIVINQKFRWPYTAYAGIKFDSKYFSGAVPSRKYLIEGILVQVPVNYDPEARTYAGFWNLEFKRAYSNNPVWIVYDMISNDIYGLGELAIAVDKSALYVAAQFCDQLVPDGRGNMEPRMVCNCNITDQRQAWDLITDVMSIFRAMPLWDGTMFSASVDFPQDPVCLYTNANVVDGDFIYGASSQEDRHSVIEIRFVDKDNSYEQATEIIVDDDLVNKYGWNKKKVDAFGTDTRSQARRVGMYILETERLESKTVSFSVGKAGLRNMPGHVISVADSRYFGTNIGGRIISVSSDRKSLTLDREVELPSNSENLITLINENSIPVNIKIESISSDKKTVTISTTCPTNTERMSVWALTMNNTGTKLYRCVTIGEDDKGNYSIQAVEHYPEKTAIIDDGVVFDPVEDTLYGTNIPAVKDLTVEATPDSEKGQVRAYWNAPSTARNVRYMIQITRDALNVITTIQAEREIYINVDKVGTYNVTVFGVSDSGEQGEKSSVVFLISAPPKPISISWTTGNLTATLKPVLSPLRTLGEQYEWFFGSSEAEVMAMTYNLGYAFVMNKVDLRPNTNYWFGVRSVNNIGKSDITTVQVLTKFDSTDLDGLINLSLPKTQYIKDINADIAGLSNLASLRVVDPNGGTPRVTGVYVNAGNAESDQASVVDIVADAFAISDPDTLTRWVFFDSVNKKLVVVGDIRANAGTLNNVIINENCTILGTLSANRIIGDLVQLNVFSKNLTRTASPQNVTFNGNPKFAMEISILVSVNLVVASSALVHVVGPGIDEYITASGEYVYKSSAALGASATIGFYQDGFNQATNDHADLSIQCFAVPSGRSGWS